MSHADRHQDRKDNPIGAKNDFETGLIEYEKQKVGPVQYLRHYVVLFNDSKIANPLSLLGIQKKERDMPILTGIGQIAFQLVGGLCSKISNFKQSPTSSNLQLQAISNFKQGSWNC